MSFKRKAGAYALRSYGVTGLRLLRNLVLMGFVSTETFGQTQMANNGIALLVGLCLPGINSVLTQLAARGELIEIKSLVRIKLLGACSCAVAMLVYALWCYETGEAPTYCLTLALLALTLPLEAFSIVRSVWLGLDRIDLIAKRDLSVAGISLALTALCAWLAPGNIVLMVVLPRLFESVSWQLPYKNLRHEFDGLRDEADYRRQKTYALHRTALMVIPNLESTIDRALVGVLYGFHELAIFSVAKFTVDQVRTFTTSIASVLTPRLSKGNDAAALRELWRIGLPATLAILALSLILMVGAIASIRLFVPRYMESERYIIMYVLGFSVSIPGALLHSFTEARRFVKAEYIFRTLNASIGLLALPLFIPFFGQDGIVYAFYAKSLATTVVTVITCRHHLWPRKAAITALTETEHSMRATGQPAQR